MQDRLFYSICFGFIFGVLLRSFILVNIYLSFLFSFIAFVLILFFYFISKSNWGIIFSCFALSFSLGIFVFSRVDVPPPNVLESRLGERVSLVGEVVDAPDSRESNTKLIVLIKNTNIKVLISTSLYQDYKYGDEISFSGVLEKPENFITDQGKTFDYINYLRKDNILYLMNFSDIEVISRDNGNKIQSGLFYIKGKFLEKINNTIPEPESLLMGGLILGERSNFNEDLRKSFIDTGTIHIVALSGYNVTIIAEWFVKFFGFLPQVFAISMGILSVLLFVLMTGASSTAIRAGIMGTLALYARASGRNYDVARALVLAGVLMILFNPFILVHDVSFQLSFIATVAVIFLAPRIEKYFTWVPKKFGLRDVVAVTFSAYIFVLPFILYKMGNLSLVALPANVLVLPFIPLTMMLGFITGFLGLFWNIIALPFSYLASLFLHYELSIISILSRIPFASLTFPDFPMWLTILIYLYFIYRLFGGVIRKFFFDHQ